MYLGESSKPFLRELSALAAPGSSLILNFLAVSPAYRGKVPGEMSEAILREELPALGWGALRFHEYGDAVLNFGRFKEGFPPSPSFSFVVATKLAASGEAAAR